MSRHVKRARSVTMVGDTALTQPQANALLKAARFLIARTPMRRLTEREMISLEVAFNKLEAAIELSKPDNSPARGGY